MGSKLLQRTQVAAGLGSNKLNFSLLQNMEIKCDVTIHESNFSSSDPIAMLFKTKIELR